MNLDYAAILNAVAKNPSDRVYTDQEIFLDGYTFTNCCFNNCTLWSDNGIFSLQSCLIMNNCKIMFGPSALRIIKLYHLKFPNPNVQGPVYYSEVGPNGTVTL